MILVLWMIPEFFLPCPSWGDATEHGGRREIMQTGESNALIWLRTLKKVPLCCSYRMVCPSWGRLELGVEAQPPLQCQSLLLYPSLENPGSSHAQVWVLGSLKNRFLTIFYKVKKYTSPTPRINWYLNIGKMHQFIWKSSKSVYWDTRIWIQ